MKKTIAFCFLLLAPAALLAAPSAKKLTPLEEVRALNGELARARKPFPERAEALQKLLAEPRIATNAAARVTCWDYIARLCVMDAWQDMWYYDYDLIKKIYPKLMPEILASDSPVALKLGFVERYVKYFGVVEKYDEGIAMVKEQMGRLKLSNPKDKARIHLALAEMYRLADRYEPAIAEVNEALKFDVPSAAAKGAAIASAWQQTELEHQYILKMSVPKIAAYVAPMPMCRYQSEVPEWIYKHLSDFVLDAKNPANERLAVYAQAFYFDLSPLGEKMTEAMCALPDEALAKVDCGCGNLGVTCEAGSWARTVKLYELGLRIKRCAGALKAPNWRRVYLTSLFASGRKADAIRLANEFATEEKVTPHDKAVYLGFAALFADKPIAPVVTEFKTDKEKSEVLKVVGRCAMTVAKTDVAERLAKSYESCFKPRETRKMKVTFSENPINSIAEWRKICDKLPKGVCDIPFGEGRNFADLVSDVTTGRQVDLSELGKKPTVKMELTCVADRYALHFFIRTPDPKARDVEHGFANGLSTEMYFAPGLDEPYICFGSAPTKGIAFFMSTLYNSLEYRRQKFVKDGGNMLSEVAFTDTDYVLRVTMPWIDLHRKLPAKPGTEWKFECIAWAPTGPMTWGGSRDIHHASDWGHLVFDLKPAELTAIKRELILANYKTWSTPKSTGRYQTLDWCEKWREDRVGDKAFYDACLKDYGAALKEMQKKVSPTMDDATVNEIYDKGLVHWLGIRYEIDAKRKNYLMDKLLGVGD